MSVNEELGKEIFALYTRNGFGRVLKSEIDQAVFHCFLLANLDKRFVKDGRIRYFHINKTELRALSIRACVTETRVKNLLETDFFHYGNDSRIEDFLLETVNSTTARKGLLRDGKINLLLPNPIAKKYIEERIFAVGGIPDYSFNKDILSLEIIDFLKMAHYNNTEEIARVIAFNILSKAKSRENNPEITAFLKELEQVPVGERLKKIARGAAEKFIGKAGDEIIGAVLDLVGSAPPAQS